MVVMPSCHNNCSIGDCVPVGAKPPCCSRDRVKWGGARKRWGHPVIGWEWEPIAPPHQSFANHCLHLECPAHLSGEGAQYACCQEAVLETLRQMWGFNAVLWCHNKAELPHCSRDRAEMGRCLEEADQLEVTLGTEGGAWDSQRRPEGCGGGARCTWGLVGEVRVSRLDDRRVCRACMGGQGHMILHAGPLVIYITIWKTRV